MNKESEALAILKQTIFHYTLGCLATGEEKAFKVIEAALKRLEKIDNTKLIIIGNPSPNESVVNKLINERMFVGDPQEMEIKPLYDESDEKKLKALEIVKKFGLEIHITELNAFVTSRAIKGIFNAYIYITDKKDEIELLKLLKEVLKDE